MTLPKSCLCISTPTSGTGSLWRILTTIGRAQYKPVKISEEFERMGRGHELAQWQPDESGSLYLYNTPHIVNAHIANPETKIILNFRDPRDLACNQYHWVFQHPTNKSAEETEEYRRVVRAAGIDQFVLRAENAPLFRSIRTLLPRLQAEDPNILVLSYSQLCLDFDNLLKKVVKFLGANPETVDWNALELERTDKLNSNPQWIGQIWTGTDINPGRYKRELTPETIRTLDARYAQELKILRSIELPQFRHYLATGAEEEEMSRVLVGKDSVLFLTRDANDTVGQISGRKKLSHREIVKMALAHLDRRIYGKTLGDFDYGHAVIPSKEVALRDFLPDSVGFEQEGPRPVRQYLEAGGSMWTPFYKPELLAKGDKCSTYFPLTDSHWNHAGALRYARAFLESVDPGLALALDAIEKRTFAAAQQGDLGIKLEMKKDEVEIIAPLKSQAALYFENKISNEGSVRWFKNPRKTGKRAFIMHDSFVLWLLGFLPEIFEEVIFLHGTIFDFDFVREFQPDVVLCLQAERFLVRVPETGGDMFDFISRQEREKGASTRFADAWAARPLGA